MVMNNVIIDPADSKYQPTTNVIRDTKEPKYQTVFTFQLMSSVIKEKKKDMQLGSSKNHIYLHDNDLQ